MTKDGTITEVYISPSLLTPDVRVGDIITRSHSVQFLPSVTLNYAVD